VDAVPSMPTPVDIHATVEAPTDILYFGDMPDTLLLIC
jgi:hypothetical protein